MDDDDDDNEEGCGGNKTRGQRATPVPSRAISQRKKPPENAIDCAPQTCNPSHASLTWTKKLHSQIKNRVFCNLFQKMFVCAKANPCRHKDHQAIKLLLF